MPRKKAYEREEVLEKAMHTFWKNGYERTSVRLLEKEMGINQFSIYDSFGNKQDLFIEVLKKYKSHVSSTLIWKLKHSSGRLITIRKFLSDYAQAVRERKHGNGCLMVNTSLEVGHTNDMVLQQLEIYFDFIRLMLQRALDKTKARGEVSKDFDPKKHAHFLLCSLQGLSVYAKFQQPEDIELFIDHIMATLK